MELTKVWGGVDLSEVPPLATGVGFTAWRWKCSGGVVHGWNTGMNVICISGMTVAVTAPITPV